MTEQFYCIEVPALTGNTTGWGRPICSVCMRAFPPEDAKGDVFYGTFHCRTCKELKSILLGFNAYNHPAGTLFENENIDTTVRVIYQRMRISGSCRICGEKP